MAEQLVSQGTIYGWLSILAAMTVLGSAEGGASELVRLISFPVAILDLPSRSVVAMSPRMPTLLGVPGEDPGKVDLHVLVEDPARLDALMDLLVDGSINAYEARRHLGGGGGEVLAAEVWVAAYRSDEPFRALCVIAPLDGEPGRYLPEPSAEAWPEVVPGLVIGTFDAEWRVEQVSMDIEAQLGYPVHEVIGTPFVSMIHADDVPSFLSAAAHSLVDRAGVGIEVRVRNRSRQWSRGRAIVTPLAADCLRFGFAMAIDADGRPDTSSRVAELERRLWRIAHEVEQSGVAAGFERIPDQGRSPVFGSFPGDSGRCSPGCSEGSGRRPSPPTCT